MKTVISLGGSLLQKVDIIKKYADVLEELSKMHKIFVVTGGGKVARDLISMARSLGASEVVCDTIGIEITRINALILSSALKNAPKKIPRSFEEAEELSKIYDIVVMGGTFPGHTTDATAALLAEYVKADLFLNATSVDGVYSEDPKVSKNAKKFEKLTHQQLVEIVSKTTAKAGASVVIDLLAAKIIERSKIKTVIFLGDPENIKKVIEGEKIGTLIES
ncbi:MAG: UMP kinase [Archaeoglobaceae archaeon]|nr:UMP kinase [Archaeoglobaceae archaeon]MCX8152263.1 UMP kinase [Archaeoglobaceae archaeon]MDW8013941.1 UMP kinase [Archaeoglobaceae archaeon]